jgi:hypothetical protein
MDFQEVISGSVTEICQHILLSVQQFWYVCSLSFEYLENCPMENIYIANKCFIFVYNFCSKGFLPG